MKQLFQVIYEDGVSTLVEVDSISFGEAEAKAEKLRDKDISSIGIFREPKTVGE
ncbi:hypothetical protein [Peribacillus frigoritolerans]|uniref:hypothetical protein n=1 Tax=Peribacillus frigoritolerans TaxID=450367 RepID=UPI003015C7FE